jgi:glycosyltransferase involved in cell wall biosynthesis
MRIAQIAPLWERVPPPGYGGIELVVGLLTDELVQRGHEVTLFATGDSITLANLESVHPRAIRVDPKVKEYSVYEMLQLNSVYEQAQKFDVIHSHVGYSALSYARFVKTPTIHTLHGAFTGDNEKIFIQARQQNFVSISDAQRKPGVELNYVSTVYNGININDYRFYSKPETPPYLMFLGRLSPEKGPHIAIQVAKRVGIPLKMAGKIDGVDQDYFESEIKPHIDGKHIEYLGEASHSEKNTLLGGAVAMLFPITWHEPFGLVMVESMAAGTPVIANRMGSTPEVIADGKTGFLCNNLNDFVAAIARLPNIDRRTCRQHVEQLFGVQRMVDGYELVYQQILAERFARNGHVPSVKNPLILG